MYSGFALLLANKAIPWNSNNYSIILASAFRISRDSEPYRNIDFRI